MTEEPISPGEPLPNASRLREHLILAGILAAWLVVNLLTIERYPCAGGDEVVYADPAINLLQNGHFTGSCWYVQPATAFWAVSVPLYPFLLYLWLKIVGFSMAGVRSLNVVLIAATAIILYRAINKMTEQGRAGAGRLFVLLLLFGYSIIFDYRGGRPDCVCILLYALAFMAVVCFQPAAKGLAVFACAFLMPWAGLQCLPTLALLGCFLLLLDWRAYLVVFLLAGFGSVCGLASLLYFYKYHGALADFHRAIVPQAVDGGVLNAILHGNFTHHNRLPKDFSFLVLFAGALLCELIWWRRGALRWRSPVLLAIGLTVIISAMLVVSGKFPTYYSWMTYLPLCVAVVAEFADRKCEPLKRKMLGATCAGAILIGGGMHLCAGWYDWSDRDPAIPENLVSRNVRPGDVPFGDPAVYYAFRHQGLFPQIGKYVQIMTPAEKQRVSIMFDKPEYFQEDTLAMGGEWQKVDEYKPAHLGFLGTSWSMGFLSIYNYGLAVYRRAGTNAPPRMP